MTTSATTTATPLLHSRAPGRLGRGAQNLWRFVTGKPAGRYTMADVIG